MDFALFVDLFRGEAHGDFRESYYRWQSNWQLDAPGRIKVDNLQQAHLSLS